MNIFTVSRFLQSANVVEAGPRIIANNLSDPLFWIITLFWPLYIGFHLYNFATGNFGD